jgi:hypothetical protein
MRGEELRSKPSTANNFTKQTKKNNFADIAMLTLEDYDRIKKNSYVKTKEEELNEKRILDEQKENNLADAKVLIFNFRQRNKKS